MENQLSPFMLASVILNNRGSAIDAVTAATRILEDSPITNAGVGSSLTVDGTVECDATVMDGKSLVHGSVGAVSGVENPILLAKKLLEAQSESLPGGLISPSFLAGPGARAWAVTHDVPVCQDQALVTEKARHIYNESMKYIRQLEERNGKKRKLEHKPGEGLKSDLMDTVGAVCVDCDGNVASAVSSGGILLKHSGRVGQAAVYGCGSWAENNYENSDFNIAVSTSGCGEHLIRTTFGRICAQSTFSTDPLGTSFAKDIQEKFLDSKFLKDVDSPMGGCLSVRYDRTSGTKDLFWLHSTRSMGVAYLIADKKNPQALFSILPEDRVGKTVALNCKSFSDYVTLEYEEVEEEEEEDVPPTASSSTTQEHVTSSALSKGSPSGSGDCTASSGKTSGGDL
ncbi:Threonine aspartase 1 [Armadillidium vulgare]|nr:Threonine aspartase 1 [Armadillidium vulgare]